MATKMKRRVSGFDPDEAPVSSNNRDNRPRPEELVEMLQMPKGKAGSDAYKRFRPVGNVFVTGQHWVVTKKRDGSMSSFPTPCLNFDPATGNRSTEGNCPWCHAQEVLPKRKNKEGKEQSLIRFASDYYIQGIDRVEQEDAPAKRPKPTADERESGFKDINSDTWTPYRVQRLAGQDLKKFRNLKDLNVVKIGGERVAKSVFDPKYGCDVLMKFDKNEAVPGNRWTFSKDERSPLTEEEQTYLPWDLSLLVPEDLDVKAAESEVKSWATRMGVAKYLAGDGADEGDDDDEDDGDEDEPKKRRTKAEVTKGMKKKAMAALDDDDDDEDDEDDAPPPKKGAKKPVKKVVDDEDDEEDDEDEDDDDDAPPPKSKKAAPAKKGKKPVVDEDDEDDDEDDEDDEPPAKSKKPVKGKKPVVEDDDEDDDEDEDTPPPKSKKPVKGKKPVVEDDDDDEDEDDDEDDAPPPKKGKKPVPPPPPKGKKGAKKVVDDDDDDDIPF